MIRFFCVSQGSSVRVMDAAVSRLEALGEGELVGHYVADRRLYEAYAPGARIERVPVWKEWEMYAAGRARRPDPNEVRAWEERLGVPSLWPALISDRRVMHGPLSKVRQQYAPRYSLDEMRGIAVEVAERIWEALERTRPDVVLGFIPVTVGDFIAHLVAEARGIPHLKVKSTKIGNYVTLTTDLLERHPHIRSRIAALEAGEAAVGGAVAAAREYLGAADRGRVSYEGSPRPTRAPGALAALARGVVALPRAAASELRARRAGFAADPQRVPPVGGVWERSVRRQGRIRAAERAMASRLLDQLPEDDFFFLPLNSEPEVALSVYSRFTLNQIEVARNVAQSIPLGTLLLVKEHPRTWGQRSHGYYRRLMEIPNLRFVRTQIPTAHAISRSRATVVISGFAAFEAVLQRVPVVTIGHTLFDALPNTMVRRVHDFDRLPDEMAALVREYRFDGAALERFVTAIIEGSVPVDLYNKLLAKPGREAGTGAAGGDHLDAQVDRFARYVLRRARDERDP
jgi:hypothetical protein